MIVLGYDTQGKTVAEKLKEEDKEFLIIDNDPEKIADLDEKEENFVYGDVFEHETWEKADYQDAQLIISTVPLERVSMIALDLETDADIILRSESIEEAQKLIKEGAIYVNVPKILSSELLADHIEGLMENRLYREDLRRRSMLELKKFMQDREG